MDLLCEKDDCENEATIRYRWPWGDEGVVCDYHATTTQQLAQQLGRDPALVPLVPATPPAPATDQVAELVDQLRAAHAELQETKSALEEAQRLNVSLSNQIGVLRDARLAPPGDATG